MINIPLSSNEKEKIITMYSTNKMSAPQISKVIGRSTHAIYNVLNNGNLTRCISEGRNPNIDLTKKKEMSYILGVLVGDGTCYSNSNKKIYSTTLRVTDKEFSDSFKKACMDIGIKTSYYLIKYKNPRHKDSHQTSFYSRIFCEWYKQLSICDIKDYIKGNELEFLRGFYESEGSIFVKKQPNKMFLTITNTNIQLIDLCKEIIDSMGMSSKVYKYKVKNRNHKPIYVITIYVSKDIKTFLENVNPCIKTNPRKKSA